MLVPSLAACKVKCVKLFDTWIIAGKTHLTRNQRKIVISNVKISCRCKFIAVSVNSPLAVEALAGLASREDFTAIHLKKTSGQSPPSGGGHYTEAGVPLLLLIHVKGRRRVQVRLVDPIADSVNSGDCFVLVTPDQVFNYNGYYSNVIER